MAPEDDPAEEYEAELRAEFAKRDAEIGQLRAEVERLRAENGHLKRAVELALDSIGGDAIAKKLAEVDFLRLKAIAYLTEGLDPPTSP